MCGIAGILSSTNKESELDRMLQVQKHRGPDNTGKFIDANFAYLGHNRLSIIDLSEQAHQPFIDSHRRYSLIFNGEIYNYKELRSELSQKFQFKTSSDTEVLLAAYITYGEDCLSKLNGMFSFAIWDKDKKELFAARDRFGVKPFYYSEESGEFYFASEIKALRSVKNVEPSLKVWSNYFSNGSYGMPDETFFKNISQLPAGHYLKYKSGKSTIFKWYDFKKRIKETTHKCLNEEFIKEYYLELLKESISLRFRADVKVGFNLSGGIDSSLLLALVNAHKHNRNVQAFTFYTGHQEYDELYWAEQMISKTKNPFSKIKLDSSDVINATEKISEIQDEPFGGVPTLAYSKIFKNASKQGVKVLLDGQGMDEQWAGYDYYGTKNKSVIQGQHGPGETFRIRCLNIEFQKQAINIKYPKPFQSEIQNTQYRDLFFTKLPRALRFNDRISMAYSTELREPFLDYRLVEFAFSLPDNYKVRNGVHKFLLRNLIKDFVPVDISYVPKRALQTPQREWLGNELRNWTETRIEKLINGKRSEWFDKDEVWKEWNCYKNGDQNTSFHIWQWINASFIL